MLLASTVTFPTIAHEEIICDRGWFEVDVDLAPWAGREIEVELINETERPRGESLWMNGWAVPRLVAAG